VTVTDTPQDDDQGPEKDTDAPPDWADPVELEDTTIPEPGEYGADA
jgi:hypothetical protein